MTAKDDEIEWLTVLLDAYRERAEAGDAYMALCNNRHAAMSAIARANDRRSAARARVAELEANHD